MALESSPIRKLLDQSLAQAAYLIGASAVYTRATLPGLLASSAENPNAFTKKVIMLGAADGPRARGAIIRPMGGASTSNNTTLNVRVSLIRIVDPALNDGSNAYSVEEIGELAVTLGNTAVAADSGYGNEQLRIADTLVYTPSARGAHYASVYTPSPLAYSPANDTQALLTIADAAGAFAIVLEPEGSVAFNAMYELIS